MKILDLLKCAKPLIFENDDHDYPYSIQGTCFLVRFGVGCYAVTAKHCLRNRKAESVRIRLHPGDLTLVPVKAVHSPRGAHGVDEDLLDLAIFEIEPALIPAIVLRGRDFLDLRHYDPRKFELYPSAILALVGYPSEANTADYEQHITNTRGFSPDGHYDGPAEAKHCSKIRFNNLGSLESLDGLSGSPAFQFRARGGGKYSHSLAGVFIRGTRLAVGGRFINAPVLLKALELSQRAGP